MKKATGELSNTLVVVISVAILIAFFFYTLWPSINANFKAETACEKAICETTPDKDGMVNCILCDSVNSTDRNAQKNCSSSSTKIKCKYKG